MKPFLPLVHRIRRELAILLILISGFSSAHSQTFTARRGVGIVPHCNGFYEYLPQGYGTGTETYPILIFNHGIGEVGDGNAGLTKLVNTGLPRLINTGGFPSSFTVNGQVFRFIVICPQYTTWPTVADVDAVLDYALAHYRVNTNRIYMTGLSMGGGITWDYAAQAKLVVKLAAIVPICGASSESKQKANVIADAGLPVWATHNQFDPTVNVNTTINYINDILKRNPSAPVKKTIFNASGHDAWTKTYNPTFAENNMNIYEWMLQFQMRGTGINLPPTVNAGADLAIILPTNSAVMKATASDPDGTIKQYAWTKTAGPAAYTISDASVLNPTISGLTPGTYTFRLTVTDNSKTTSFDDINIVVNTATNQLPTVNAGADVNLTLPSNSVVMKATASDPDGSISKYVWTKIAGPATFSITSTSVLNPTISGLTPGTYTFRLTVTDNGGATAFDDINININSAANQPPVVNAGVDINITLPTSSAVMKATASDADGSISKYAWTKTAGPTAFSISNAAILNPTISGLSAGSYTFRLTVTDNSGGSTSDDINIIVNPAVNQPPVVNAGVDITLTLPTNSAVMKATASDADGAVAKYAWTKIAGPAAFSISNAAILNPTISGLSAGSYTFRLTVTDNSGASTSNDINIFVNPAGNVAPLVSTGLDLTITLPTNSIVMKATASDADGSIATYAWTKIAGPASYSFSNASILNPTIGGLVAGTYTFKLTVTDNSGASASDDINVIVNPAANKVPIVNAGSDVTITLPSSTVLMKATASDPDGSIVKYAWTKISGPAVYSISNTTILNPTMSGLSAGTFTFRLSVTDNSGAVSFDDVNIIIKAAVNQPPTDNAGADVTITLPTSSVVMKATASDADGSIVKYSWTETAGPVAYAISDPSVLNPTISGLTAGTYTFSLAVTDNNGATANDDINIVVKPKANQTPTVNAGPNITVTLPTNSAVMKASASDPDGSIVKYTWTKAAGPVAYSISDPSILNPTISGLTAGTYTFSLTVTDNNGATINDNINIVVNNAPATPPPANIPPSVSVGTDVSITLPVNLVTMKATASDPDGSIATYAWTKLAGPASFSISNNAILNPTIGGLVAGTYTFRLIVTDNSGSTANDDIKIVVIPAATPPPNISPVVNAGADVSITLPINSVLMNANSSDPDGSITKYNWTKIAGPVDYSIDNATTLNPSINGLVAGIYTFRLVVTDNNGATAYDDVNIIVSPAPNLSPVANAGQSQTITASESLSLDGTNSFDPDGAIVQYQWTLQSGDAGAEINDPYSPAPTVSGLIPGEYIFILTVTDDQGASASDFVTITVNEAIPASVPVAISGSDTTITYPESSTVELDGSASYDNGGTITGYTWSQLDGPSTVLMDNAYASVNQVSNLMVGDYHFVLTITDNNGMESSDTVTIHVNSSTRNTGYFLKVYPNPVTTGVVYFEGYNQSVGRVSVTVYDITGRVLKRLEFEKNAPAFKYEIPVADLHNSVYLINVLFNGSLVPTVYKIIKQ